MLHDITRGLATLLLFAASGWAQSPVTAGESSSRLEQVLPAAVAARVRVIVASARARGLPSDALENRALKFAARGVNADSIEKSVSEQAVRMEKVRDTLQRARGTTPSGDEIEAGAEALRKGVDGARVSAFARSAPGGRSLAVPFYVIGGLIDHGVPADVALSRVEERLAARTSDHDLEKLPYDAATTASRRRGNSPAETGRELDETKRPGSAAGAGKSGTAGGGPPAGVPANGGAKSKPAIPGEKKPTAPGKKP